MAKKSKKMQDALKKIDATKAYPVGEAVALAKEINFAKFDAIINAKTLADLPGEIRENPAN